jgi:hypothetical protein
MIMDRFAELLNELRKILEEKELKIILQDNLEVRRSLEEVLIDIWRRLDNFWRSRLLYRCCSQWPTDGSVCEDAA